MKRTIRKHILWPLMLLVIAGLAGGYGLRAAGEARQHAAEKYAYHSARFTELLRESNRVVCEPGERHDFYRWMDRAYRSNHARLPGERSPSLEAALRAERQRLRRIARAKRTDAEVALAASLHRLVKTIIPKFSLERGFEFCNVIECGERQCLLQSVLIASLLQDAGVDAGTVMVYRNPSGEESNNGHVVVLMKLPNGRDLLVDASDKEPFVRHQGLFVRSGGYRYVKPVYARDSDEIAHYQTTSENAEVGTARVRPLDFAFVRSQFWYYRGERVEGGLLSAKKTQAGLEAAARYLRTSVRVCPENPLAVYMLGRVHWSQGRAEQARKQFNAADALYSRFGWIPEGPQEYRALANRPIVEGARR